MTAAACGVATAREIHIASLLVHARPDRLADIKQAIAAMPGAEIHVEVGGKLVVTLEATSDAALAERFAAIGCLGGVLAAAPVYHHIEPCEETPCCPAAT
jgi:periplasmic nitrate reductase NapD